MDVPPAQFFKGSPLLEVLDFLERLAPFSEPDLTLADARPMMTADLAGEPLPSPRPSEANARPAEPAAPSAYDLLRQSLGRP
jgi:nitrous oxidase accessory protein